MLLAFNWMKASCCLDETEVEDDSRMTLALRRNCQVLSWFNPPAAPILYLSNLHPTSASNQPPSCTTLTAKYFGMKGIFEFLIFVLAEKCLNILLFSCHNSQIDLWEAKNNEQVEVVFDKGCDPFNYVLNIISVCWVEFGRFPWIK